MSEIVNYTQKIWMFGKLHSIIPREGVLGERKKHRGYDGLLDRVTSHSVLTRNGWCLSHVTKGW